jgi:hypothetical protein
MSDLEQVATNAAIFEPNPNGDPEANPNPGSSAVGEAEGEPEGGPAHGFQLMPVNFVYDGHYYKMTKRTSSQLLLMMGVGPLGRPIAESRRYWVEGGKKAGREGGREEGRKEGRKEGKKERREGGEIRSSRRRVPTAS